MSFAGDLYREAMTAGRRCDLITLVLPRYPISLT